MNKYYLSDLAKYINGELYGEDRQVSNVSIDSRTILENDIFICIKGEKYDGHNFIEDSLKKALCVISEKKLEKIDLKKKSYIRVDSTLRALQKISEYNRHNCKAKFIAITGSNGKTTVKELLSHILSDHKITYTKENFNNQIGVPLTLLSATNDDDYVIVEAGTNSPGEIESLVKLIKPDIAAVTNVGYAHLESFKTLDKIAKEKYSIFNYLKKNGLAIINAEDKYIGIIKKRKKLFFGYKNHIGFFSKFSKVLKNLFYKTNFLIIEKINNNIFIINYKKEEVCIKLNLKGDHNFLNVSCAASIAISLGIKINIIKQKIETFEAVKSRLKLHKIDNNIIIIDDCYNANPNSFFAALDYLSGLDGLKIVLMGDMAELGKDSVYFHVKVGEYAKKLGIHKFLSIGENSKFASLVFGNQGYHFDDEENLKFFLTNNIKSSTFLLIKGSRSAKLEKFVEFLKTWSYS